jgi:hypothetical protein
MKKIVVAVALFISLIMLSACSSSPSEPQKEAAQLQSRAERMTVVNSGEPMKVLPAFTTFTWNDGYNHILSAVDNQQADALKSYIREQIITYLKTKGYRYQADPAQADVVLGFLFALQDAHVNKGIQSQFGSLPGMAKFDYKKGTFLLTVLDSELNKVYWRSAVQGFVDLEKERQAANNLPIQNILGIMMGGFPKAGR